MKPPAFQFYADDFLAGTSDMSPEEVGIYIRLLCHQWAKGGVPAEESRLARMAGIDGNAMLLPSLRYVVGKFTAHADGCLRNARLERVREEQAENRAKRSAAGAKGAESRWGNGKHDGNAMAKPLASSSQNNSSPSPTPSPITENTNPLTPLQGDKPVEEKPPQPKEPKPKGPLQLRAEAIMGRRPSTPLTSGESRAFSKNRAAIEATTEEDWRTLERFYAAPQSETFARKDLGTLLNNWNGEIDKAKAFFTPEKQRLPVAPPAPKIRIPDNLRPDYTR